MPRKRQQEFCLADAKPPCAQPNTRSSRPKPTKGFSEKALAILKRQHVDVPFQELERFIAQLSRSDDKRKDVARKRGKNRNSDDIIGLIQLARDADDDDEAIWRSFLAAHFGRASADSSKPSQMQSASKVLCAFGTEPFWTWQRVSKDGTALRRWLLDHRSELKTLSFGNHRKYESKKAKGIWAVIKSFFILAEEYGGPLGLFSLNSLERSNGFDVLYFRLKSPKLESRKLKPLVRFGRTGRFDFLVLLNDLRLISAEPASCYLHGATGPLKGAKELWRNRPPRDLERLAAELGERLKVSPVAVEDALCIWQKQH